MVAATIKIQQAGQFQSQEISKQQEAGRLRHQATWTIKRECGCQQRHVVERGIPMGNAYNDAK